MPANKPTLPKLTMSNAKKVGDIVVGEYKILREIDRAGFGIIYLAQYLGTRSDIDKEVAVKIVKRTEDHKDSDWSKLLAEQITSIRVTGFPNIVKTFDFITLKKGEIVPTDHNPDEYIIVMEYIDGKTLDHYLKDNITVNLDDAVGIFKKIIIGVQSLHTLGERIIHRDLKPENIMISDDLIDVKIIDFGVSSVFDVATGQYKTNEETHFGTAYYLPPEIYSSKMYDGIKWKPIPEQIDFYAAGVMLYEMLMGQKPWFFDRKKYKADEEKRYVKDYALAPAKFDMLNISKIDSTIPVAIENIIFRCLASKQEDIKYRYNSASEILEDLKSYENKKNNNLLGSDFLIKPAHKRFYQNSMFPNIYGDKVRRRLFEQKWFYIMVTIIILTVIIVIIIYHVLRPNDL
ncbi:MAG: serine/threonine protein kinase [Mycoplasmataceae bacterium]|nr:serine/threonine protein kinase [Mycoplasmataceae bacterium]